MKKTTDRHYNYQAIELTEENQATTKELSQKNISQLCVILQLTQESNNLSIDRSLKKHYLGCSGVPMYHPCTSCTMFDRTSE
jgi:hypothetical protein